MRNERSDSIDALIDEAARRLVAGEPSSSLRSGVRSRIGRRWSAWWSFTPALAGAAMVVIAIIGRTFLGPVDAPDHKNSIAARTAAERPAAAVASLPADVSPIQPVLSTPRQLARRLAADVTAPPPAEEESPIPPIAIEPLATAPLGAAQIAVDVSSGVIPIEIAPLQIEPLLGQ